MVRIPDGDYSHRRMPGRYVKQCTRAHRVKTTHLVNQQSHYGRFICQVKYCFAGIVKCVGIATAVFLEVELDDCKDQYRRSPGLCDVRFRQATQQPFASDRIVLAGDHKTPWLFVSIRGSPTCRFQQAEEFADIHLSLRKGGRTKAGSDQTRMWARTNHFCDH